MNTHRPSKHKLLKLQKPSRPLREGLVEKFVTIVIIADFVPCHNLLQFHNNNAKVWSSQGKISPLFFFMTIHWLLVFPAMLDINTKALLTNYLRCQLLGSGNINILDTIFFSLLPVFLCYLKLPVQWNSQKYDHVTRYSLNNINFKCGYILKGFFFS